MGKYFILSLDGGGIRGLYSALLLSMLNEKTSFIQDVDLFAGTSTGAILAACLAQGITPADLVAMYGKLGSAAFIPTNDLEKSKYENAPLKQLLLETVFQQNPTLNDIPNKICIPSLKLSDEAENRCNPCVFHNFEEETAKQMALVDVVVASSSAPIYFPSHKGYVDGGFFAVNPSMIALTTALDCVESLDISDVSLLSVGTGKMPVQIKQEISWNAKLWGESKEKSSCGRYPMFSVMTESSSESTHRICKVLLSDSYRRLNTDLDEIIEVDDMSKVDALVEKAMSVPMSHPKLWDDLLTWIDSCIVDQSKV